MSILMVARMARSEIIEEFWCMYDVYYLHSCSAWMAPIYTIQPKKNPRTCEQLWIACFLIIATSGCMTKDANRTDFSQSVSKSGICNSTWVTVRNTNTWKWSGSDQRLWWECERRAITIIGETYLTATQCKEFCLATIFSCRQRNNVNSCEIKLLVKMFQNDSHKKHHSVHFLSSYMIIQTAQCPFVPSNSRFVSFSLNSSLLSNGL